MIRRGNSPDFPTNSQPHSPGIRNKRRGGLRFLDCRKTTPETSPLDIARRDLASRLDDLRGFGLLPGGTELPEEGDEAAMLHIALGLADALETTQRRVIETSIQ